jgi:hypothetical protein
MELYLRWLAQQQREPDENLPLGIILCAGKNNDAQLLPAAGACSSCPKRSASNLALFAELTVKGEDTCMLRGIWLGSSVLVGSG